MSEQVPSINNVNLMSMGITMRQLADVWQEALKEIELTELKRGAGNGKTVYVRIMYLTESLEEIPQWIKVYVYLIGSKYFVDAQPVSDEEVLKCGSSSM